MSSKHWSSLQRPGDAFQLLVDLRNIKHPKEQLSWVCLCTPLTPVCSKLRLEDWKFKSILGHQLRSCLKRLKRMGLGLEKEVLLPSWE